MFNFDEMQKFGKDAVEATVQSMGTASRGAQTVATEAAEFARKSFEQGAAAMERLMNARSVERAVEVQSQYVQNVFEGAMAQGTKMNELVADLTKQSMKPVETYFGKVRPTA